MLADTAETAGGREVPIIIAHRGNTRGPRKELENTLPYIQDAIAQGFDVEVDVWSVDGQLFLGHDEPEIPIEPSFLDQYAANLWCHAKNVHALGYLLSRRDALRSFSHDVDPHVITSDGRIWTYPGRELVKGAISVMPERSDHQTGIWNCYGICTDFAMLYATYVEMRTRNRKKLVGFRTKKESDYINPLIVDKLLHHTLIDERRCLAVYTYYDDFAPTPAWSALNTYLAKEFGKQNIYDVAGPISFVHWTFMQILGFEQWEEHSATFACHQSKYLAILREEMATLLPLTIKWSGLVAVPNGLVMLGYPSVDVNIWRQRIESRLEKEGLPFRRYQNDIVHSTILRLSADESPERLIAASDAWQDVFFGTLAVSKFQVGRSSWRMQPTECVTVDVVENNWR
ncbi:hypothetical protein SpCBS45565_g05742 [Spizellomyces sp. 'palustris']|nr:hypothetical protein SpCBS45565_g05742 [Spizellomyces sp. 'palustris']